MASWWVTYCRECLLWIDAQSSPRIFESSREQKERATSWKLSTSDVIAKRNYYLADFSTPSNVSRSLFLRKKKKYRACLAIIEWFRAFAKFVKNDGQPLPTRRHRQSQNKRFALLTTPICYWRSSSGHVIINFSAQLLLTYSRVTKVILLYNSRFSLMFKIPIFGKLTNKQSFQNIFHAREKKIVVYHFSRQFSRRCGYSKMTLETTCLPQKWIFLHQFHDLRILLDELEKILLFCFCLCFFFLLIVKSVRFYIVSGYRIQREWFRVTLLQNLRHALLFSRPALSLYKSCSAFYPSSFFPVSIAVISKIRFQLVIWNGFLFFLNKYSLFFWKLKYSWWWLVN